MPRRILFAATCAAVAALSLQAGGGLAAPAAALSTEWRENPQSRVRLITPYRVAPDTGEIWLGLHFTLAPGWHVYWKNSGDAGFPPVLETSGAPDLEDAEILYPAPERYELPGDLVAYGYDAEVVYPVRARLTEPPGGAPRESVDLAIDLDYLVCEVDCVPYRYTFRLEQPIGPETAPDPRTAPLLERWRERLPKPVNGVPGASTEGVIDASEPGRPVLWVTVEGVRPAPGERPRIFLEHHELFGIPFEPGGPRVEESAGGLRFRVPLERRKRLDRPPETTTFAWTVTGLDGPVALEARRAVPIRTAARTAAAPGAGASGPPIPDSTPDSTPLSGLAGTWVLALAGGMLLDLTPGCLALFLAFLLGFRAVAEHRKALPLGLTACAGAVAGSTLLASFSIALDLGGTGGSHLREPTTVAALALLCLAQTLWLWGLVGEAGERLSPRRLGTGPAAAAGALAPLLALPWPLGPLSPLGPIPGAIDRAGAAGPVALVVAGAAAGLGIGLPWLVGALMVDRVADRRPETDSDRGSDPDRGRPPAERTRQGLGFLALLSVAWLLYLLSGDLRTEYLAFVELSLLTVALMAWLVRHSRRPMVQTVFTILLLAAAVATVWLADRGRLRVPLRDGSWDNPRARMTEEVLPWHDPHDVDTPSTRSRPPSRS
ncbi:MAG: protein-disulfide reductase DsbD family protein [Acidobacteriota bacterium]|jgi:suppressor for copper-sensitivity B